jgi:predicted RecB family nuclease
MGEMQRRGGEVLYSAGDVVAFLECQHATALSLIDLDTPLKRAEDDASLELIQNKGFSHEAGFLDSLKAKKLRVAEIPGDGRPEDLVAQTMQAMHEGHDVVFQAALRGGPFYGRADFLRRVDQPSNLGAWRYEAADTKLARSAKAKFLIQLAFYSDLLGEVQGAEPGAMHLVLGDGGEHNYRVADFSRYYGQVRDRFLDFTAKRPNDTYPERCDYCPFCPWRDLCADRWTKDDHLNQVADIRRTQIDRLRAAGITTLASLARLSAGAAIPRLHADTLAKLRGQARLQLERRESGKPVLEALPLDPDGRRGFYRLPQPDAGDLFFDMEGDPFEADGLEYLFGVRYVDRGKPRFRAFWAHDRLAEKKAFEELMDFFAARLARYPAAHIYHYAHYEPTALKRLMSLHGTREAQVDDLLRNGKLVDLYKVVREALRVSEGYSLKDIEVFYMAARAAAVKDAGGSIVEYERWRQSQDPKILAEIEHYNAEDCESTHLLREWLLAHRPGGMPWFKPQAAVDGTEAKSERTRRIEAELEQYRTRLMGGAVEELVFQLLDFHRRCAKPAWWAVFARQDMTEDELIEDLECLGGLTRDRQHPPVAEGRSLIHTFRFPEQETKLRAGHSCRRTDTAEPVGTIVELDEAVMRILIKSTKNVPDAFSIGPSGPIDTEVLRTALLRVADSVASRSSTYPAAMAFLRKEPPRLRGRKSGAPILPGRASLIAEAIAAVEALDQSYLCIQGPPGAGKTFTGSHLIVHLLSKGKRVGVTSNSHKAINNLLAAVERVAVEKKVNFSGVKKSTATDPDTVFNGKFIESIANKDDAIEEQAQLLAGTAWLFADEALEQSFDYLFVDEAGQVSLANLVASGTAARNIVLLGDQMQLGQPIQGVHPGRSGESALDYLLDGLATIPSARGIFLPTSFRMHEDVCRFISEAVYDGRLRPEPANQTQTLLLGKGAHPALRPTGIVFLPLEHDGNSQRSREEVDAIAQMYESLLAQRYRDKQGREHAMTAENVLVVAPYNSQVNLLKSCLPAGVRVGTIDKFQGQEAEAVLISMATSSGEHLPRNIEFLYDKNRLNVAISRGKCLVVVVASPALLRVKCGTPEQMQLVNTLCWVSSYSI